MTASSSSGLEPIETVIGRDVIAAGERVSGEAAQRILDRKAEALPYLIKVVKGDRYWTSEDEDESWAPITAMHLLSLTREEEALEAIIYAVYNHSEELGDWLAEDVASLFAYFGEERLDRVAALVSDRNLDPFAKDAAARAMIAMAEKSNNRGPLMKSAADRLRNAISVEKDRMAASLLALDLAETKDRDSLPFIKSLYDRGLIDTELATYQDMDEICNGRLEYGGSGIEVARKNPMDYFSSSDTETEQARTGDDEDDEDDEDDDDGDEDEGQGRTRYSHMAFRCPECGNVNLHAEMLPDAILDEKGGAVRRHGEVEGLPYTSIGRNEPCPCGSGKKYKKCCLPSIQRWEIIDKKMGEGYWYLEKEGVEGKKKRADPVKASECWLDAWKMMRSTIDSRARRIGDVRTPFYLRESLANWVQEFEMELRNAALQERRFHEVRIELSRWFYQQFTDEDDHELANFRASEATSLAGLGDTGGAEKKFEELVGRYPAEVWGWIFWSDMYWLSVPGKGKKDYGKAESILLRCLEEKGLDEQDRRDAEERLAWLGEERSEGTSVKGGEGSARPSQDSGLREERSEGKVGAQGSVASGQKLSVEIVGYDDEGNGYALRDGVSISVPESRIGDSLEVEVASSPPQPAGAIAKAAISSITARRKVGNADPIFNDEEIDRIERSLPRQRYRYSERLKAYYAEQAITVPGLLGKHRMLFVRLDLESRDYEAQMTSILGAPAEELILTFYSAMGRRP
jgi:predicted RNA-binding protein with TRAM domain